MQSPVNTLVATDGAVRLFSGRTPMLRLQQVAVRDEVRPSVHAYNWPACPHKTHVINVPPRTARSDKVLDNIHVSFLNNTESMQSPVNIPVVTGGAVRLFS